MKPKMLFHLIRSNYRKFRAKLRLAYLKDGTYLVDYPVYHYSLRPDRSSTFENEVSNFGRDVALRWSRDGCGVASIKMAVVALRRKTQEDFNLPSISEISERMINGGGYLKNIGWIHRSLVDYAIDNDLRGNNQVYESYLCICREILNSKLVISSVTLYFKGGQSVDTEGGHKILPKGGHLVVIKGFKWENGRCLGFVVDDPQNKDLLDESESSEFVGIDSFRKSYSEKSIYISNI